MKEEVFEIDYSLKRAIIRISIIISIILLIFFLLIFLFKQDPKKEKEIFYENSKGSFYSLNSSVKIQGIAKINKLQNKVFLKNFKITNNKNLVLKICDEFCENEIFISKLKGNTGNFKFEIPKKINVSNYFKFVFFDEKNDLNLAFFIIKEVLE